MEVERKDRVAMTKDLKKKVFQACLVRVVRGNLPLGSLKEVAQKFHIHQATVARLWNSTLKQVPGYQPNASIDPVHIADTIPDSVFETKFQEAGRPPRYLLEDIMNDIKEIDPESRSCYQK